MLLMTRTPGVTNKTTFPFIPFPCLQELRRSELTKKTTVKPEPDEQTSPCPPPGRYRCVARSARHSWLPCAPAEKEEVKLQIQIRNQKNLCRAATCTPKCVVDTSNNQITPFPNIFRNLTKRYQCCFQVSSPARVLLHREVKQDLTFRPNLIVFIGLRDLEKLRQVRPASDVPWDFWKKTRQVSQEVTCYT